MKLSPHFSYEEATQTAVDHPNEPPESILEVMYLTAWQMEAVRAILGGRPIRVTSWFRSPNVNHLVGGADSSAHQFGVAVDFVVENAAWERAAAWATKIKESGLPFDQLITYEGKPHVHISFDPRMRRERLHL